jgi:hypothetical protein
MALVAYGFDISLHYPREEGGILLLAHGDNYLPPQRLDEGKGGTTLCGFF